MPEETHPYSQVLDVINRALHDYAHNFELRSYDDEPFLYNDTFDIQIDFPEKLGPDADTRVYIMIPVQGTESIDELLEGVAAVGWLVDNLKKRGYRGKLKHDDTDPYIFYRVKTETTAQLEALLYHFNAPDEKAPVLH